MGGIPQRLGEPQKPTDINDCPVSCWVRPAYLSANTWEVWRTGWTGRSWSARADHVAKVSELGAAVLMADALNAQAAAAQEVSIGDYTAHELAGRLLEFEPDAVVVMEVDEDRWGALGRANPGVFDFDTWMPTSEDRLDRAAVGRVVMLRLEGED